MELHIWTAMNLGMNFVILDRTTSSIFFSMIMYKTLVYKTLVYQTQFVTSLFTSIIKGNSFELEKDCNWWYFFWISLFDFPKFHFCKFVNISCIICTLRLLMDRPIEIRIKTVWLGHKHVSFWCGSNALKNAVVVM